LGSQENFGKPRPSELTKVFTKIITGFAAICMGFKSLGFVNTVIALAPAVSSIRTPLKPMQLATNNTKHSQGFTNRG
jgi:hypothetical protein